LIYLIKDLVERNARRILGPKFKQLERMASSFQNPGLEMRYSFAPTERFYDTKNWQDRNALYLQEGKALFVAAASRALRQCAGAFKAVTLHALTSP